MGVRAAIQVIDPEEQARREQEENERIERIKAQKTVYDVKGDRDINPVNFTAKRVIDGETVTFNWTQKNSYIILDDEQQVLQFRLQHAPKPDESNLPSIVEPPAVDAVIEEPQFPETTESTSQGGLGMVDPAQGAGTAVSREDFEALKQRVERLEQRARGEVAA
jgi:hypothetical protein